MLLDSDDDQKGCAFMLLGSVGIQKGCAFMLYTSVFKNRVTSCSNKKYNNKIESIT